MNLNNFAVEVAHREGKKISVDIAQIKEIIRICFEIFAEMDSEDILATINRYADKGEF